VFPCFDVFFLLQLCRHPLFFFRKYSCNTTTILGINLLCNDLSFNNFFKTKHSKTFDGKKKMCIIKKVLNQIICVWNELGFPIFHVMELINMLYFLCLAMGFRVEGKVALNPKLNKGKVVLMLILECHGSKQLLNYKR
jgi:hypothetical protein